ncbi:Hypothetical protein A7982_03765 [Minicystis rosea]|nr:Hypothetical protein A7982_03765 [Minicystis rosea]
MTIRPSAPEGPRSDLASRVRRHAPALAVVIAAALVGGAMFGRFLFPYAVPVGFDEAYMVPFAERVIDGKFLPYVDAVSQRGPVLYWVLALGQLVFGRYEWIGIRVIALAACLITLVATYLAGVAARWPLAGAFGGAATVLVIALHGAPVALCGEAVAAPCLALAFAALAFAQRRAPAGRRRMAWLALSGALAATATLAKQTTGLASGPLLLWVLAQAFSEAHESPSRGRFAFLREPFAFLAGWVAVMATLFVWYAAHHALAELVYWSTTYNSTIYMAPYKAHYWRTIFRWLGAHLPVLAAVILVLVFAVARTVTAGRCSSVRHVAAAYARSGFEVTAALNAVLLFAAAALPARFWWHYFLVVWPWFGVVAGAIVEIALRRGAGPTLRKQALLAGPLAVLIAGAGVFRMAAIEEKRAHGAYGNPRKTALCETIDRQARRGESIFVWGFEGDVYINCRRRPATRFTYLTLVAGIVPPYWDVARPDRVARDARKLLLADLEKSRPALVLDYPIHGFSMTHVPELSELLARDYCPLPRPKGKMKHRPNLYGRRNAETCEESLKKTARPRQARKGR